MIRGVGLKTLMLLPLVLTSFHALAYYDDKDEEHCREPKVQEFNLPEFHAGKSTEVPPESEFSFVVSGWADPKKIKVMGKDKPIPFTVESNETFHKVKGNIPAEYTGKYIRLNVRIPAILGCYASQGWLLKVAEKTAAAPEATQSPAETASEKAAPAKPAEAQPQATTDGSAPKPESNAVKPEPAPQSSTQETAKPAEAPLQPTK